MINEGSSVFDSPTFVSIWNKHFNSSGSTYGCTFLSPIEFVRGPFNVYSNVGKRVTQGIHYNFIPELSKETYDNRIYLIYDVPSYCKTENYNQTEYRIRSVKQYMGYGINLDSYDSASDYFQNQFRSKSKWNYRKSFKRLHDKFKVTSEVFTGSSVTLHKYLELLDTFKRLLQKRYATKNQRNPWLHKRNWEYLHELIYALMLENKALIIVVYANNNPVSIHINYLSANALILAYPVFDIDYAKYNVGHFTTYLSLKWCKENGIGVYDFSKGHFDYKKKWSNYSYSFDYHIICHRKNHFGRLISEILLIKFRLKNWLRTMKFDSLYQQLWYRHHANSK